MAKTVIVGGARTAIGKMSGALANFSAAELGAKAIAAALDKARVPPTEVDYVILGQVVQAGAGQNPARQAAVAAGIPMTTPSITVNKVCLSGINAIAQADQMLRLGDADIIVAGGMESMTKAPHLFHARPGLRLGDGELIDSMNYDGLTCAIDRIGMGAGTEQYNVRYDFGRREQDEFAARSHELAAKAQKEGLFEAEIVPLEVPQRKGDPIVVDTDEGVRPGTTVDALAKLPPAFSEGGTITAANASQISDGACAVVLTTPDKAGELGLAPIAEIVAHGQVAGEDPSLHAMPARAIEKAAEKAGIAIDDIDLFEINEAFAAVVLASVGELGISLDRVNVNGGAIALGHPIGMSGARLVLHGVLEQRRRGGGIVAAALCGGGGQGDGMILRAL